MYSIGKMLSLMPQEQILPRLEPILSPYLQELDNVSNQTPSPHAKPKVDFVFKLLTMLIQSLEPPQQQNENAAAKTNMPVQVLFPQIYPIIKRVAEKWYKDSDVIECMCNLLNQCVQTLQDNIRQALFLCPLVST